MNLQYTMLNVQKHSQPRVFVYYEPSVYNAQCPEAFTAKGICVLWTLLFSAYNAQCPETFTAKGICVFSLRTWLLWMYQCLEAYTAGVATCVLSLWTWLLWMSRGIYSRCSYMCTKSMNLVFSIMCESLKQGTLCFTKNFDHTTVEILWHYSI